MEFHKPKPVHNWREFLKEYAIIVLGILTALAGEQAVEWLHWQGEVAVSRRAIQAEMMANTTNLFAFRIAVAPCVDKEIAKAEKVVATLEAGQKLEPVASFRGATGSVTRISEWQSDRASQVLTHFPRDELALMSRHYDQIPNFENWARQEGDGWTELLILQRPLGGITRSDLIRLRVSLENVKTSENLIVTNSRRQVRLLRQLGLPDAPVDAVRVRNFCTMSTEDYRRYRSAQDFR